MMGEAVLVGVLFGTMSNSCDTQADLQQAKRRGYKSCPFPHFQGLIFRYHNLLGLQSRVLSNNFQHV